jgi:hypothetical protein
MIKPEYSEDTTMGEKHYVHECTRKGCDGEIPMTVYSDREDYMENFCPGCGKKYELYFDHGRPTGGTV